MIDLTSLRMFITVVEEGSISRAAQREHIATSALSKRMADLESAVGAQLLMRRRRGVEVTEPGRVVAERARVLVHQLEELRNELTATSRGLRGVVRVAANPSSIVQFLPAELKSFVDEHPHVRIELVEGNSNDVLRSVTEARTDIGVCAWGPGQHELEAYPYRHDNLVLVTPRGHALSTRRALHLHEALDLDFIEVRRSSALSELLVNAAARVNRRIKFRLQVNSFDAALAMVRADMGLVVMPRAMVQSGRRRPAGVHVVRLRDEWATRRFCVVVRSWHKLPPPASQLASRLIQRR